MEEGHGSSETTTKTQTDCSEIETTAESLDESMIFHAISDITAFVLFMHQQIPSMLPDITLEFNTLRQEHDELKDKLSQTLGKASLRRQHASQMREAKWGMRRFEKLMRSVSNFHAALKLAIAEVCDIGEAVLALGASPLRPQHVYELSFLHSAKSLPAIGGPDFAKTRVAEALSRKAIRTLISMGAGSGPYPGTSKLFLLVKAPSSFHQPLHFLPKRDFKYSKKIVPFRMRFKCKTGACEEIEANDPEPLAGGSVGLTDPTQNELIWFQCRHTIKGIAFNTQSEECE